MGPGSNFEPKFGFYVIFPPWNRLEMSRIRNLGPKMPKLILDEDFGASTGECARPLAKLEYDEYRWSTEKSHTPAILSGCGGFFYAPRVPPRRRSRKFSRKFVKKSYFANFSDAPDARGRRELPVVKISALNDPWRYQKRQKNRKKKIRIFYDFGIQFFIIFVRFWRR